MSTAAEKALEAAYRRRLAILIGDARAWAEGRPWGDGTDNTDHVVTTMARAWPDGWPADHSEDELPERISIDTPNPNAALFADEVEKNQQHILENDVSTIIGIIKSITHKDLAEDVTRSLCQHIDMLPWPLVQSPAPTDGFLSAGQHQPFVDHVLSSLTNDADEYVDMYTLQRGWRQRTSKAITIASHISLQDLRLAEEAGVTTPKYPATFRSTIETIQLVSTIYFSTLTRPSLSNIASKQILSEAKDDPIAEIPEAIRELSRAVEDSLENAPREEARPTVVDGIHPLDEALSRTLSSIGKSGQKLAEQVHEAASARTPQERSARWALLAEPLRVPRLLARALWVDVVKPRLERLSSSHAALARVVHVDVIGLLRSGLSVRDNHVVDTDGRQRMLWTQSQALNVPTVEMGALPKLLSRGLEMLGSIQAHRIVRHVVVEGHRRVITGEADPRVLRYQGGWSALAQQANVTEPEDARAIVVALAHAAHELPDGAHGNLLSYTSRRGTRGTPGTVSVTLGDMLLPHYVHSMDQSKGRTATEHRQLVPIVDFAGFVGRNNGHAAQATLQMMLVARLRTAAAELAETGAVTIPDSVLVDLAAEAGLSRDLLPKVIDRWTRDGDDAPAFLVKQGDRYTLAEHFRPALDFLVDAGQQSIARSKAGKASVARRGKAPRKTKEAP